MKHEVELRLLPAEGHDHGIIRSRGAEALGIDEAEVLSLRLLRRSVDARGRQPKIVVRAVLFTGAEPDPDPPVLEGLHQVDDRPEVLIIGAGPAGYFAALQALRLNLKPVILERGKDVRARRRDLRKIQQFGEVDSDSNYCFGEGGAGTYSDGKLYTRSVKRGNSMDVLRLLVEHGAPEDILIDAHPHIGSNKLPGIVANIRQTILQHGGAVHFGARVTDFILQPGKLLGVIVNGEREYRATATVLATGHSARDIYDILQRQGIDMQRKPFALGVRVEHPQSLIDQLQYGPSGRDEHLPAASYQLACQVTRRGVFSFCMCPGGLIVPAATAPGEIVVNGMSLSRRDSAFANAGTVVEITLDDLAADVLAGVDLQRQVEQAMFLAGDGSQSAPAQRLIDFVRGRLSDSLPESSYIPGVFPAMVSDLLPEFVYRRLKAGIVEFGKKMKGYFTNEAIAVGTESRTSAPVWIPRDSQSRMHADVQGLFPCGEGAGFAGGILSAAMDGQNTMEAIYSYYRATVQ